MPLQRYMQKGTTRFYWVPTVAATTLIPTAAEVTAGSRLDTQLFEIDGFNYATTFIEAPNMAEAFTPKELGSDEAADSTLGFYLLKGGTDTIRALFVRGTAGFVVIFYAGIAGATPAAADKADVWPVTIGGKSKLYTVGNELSRYRVGFGVTATPAEEITIAA